MISLELVILILFIHWVADFVCQTHWQATNKSKNDLALVCHVASYTAVWTIPILILFHFAAVPALHFLFITFFAHFWTDYFTSRWTSKLYAKGDFHNFFVVIGFDQILHYVQLFGTLYLIVYVYGA